MVLRLGLIVNPIAGIGGPAALKGSDGVATDAAQKGYTPEAHEKARRFLTRLRAEAPPQKIRIFAAPGVMGRTPAQEAGWKCGTLGAEAFLTDAFATDATDTIHAAQEAVRAAMDLVVFVGGDGTARDVATGLAESVPVLGVPAGVKMFSECFADTPEAGATLVADIARRFAEGDDLDTEAADVLDLDEAAYREGTMNVLHHAAVRVPRSPRVQSAKCPACPPEGLDEVVGEIRLRMEDDPSALYLIASGSTTRALKEALGVTGTLIGVDVIERAPDADGDADGLDTMPGWRVTVPDADRRRLDAAAKDAQATGRRVVLVVSPIGGQGFVLGRGTAQIGPNVVRAALPDDLWVIATRGKLDTIEDAALHVDTGDPELDASFPTHLRVVTGLDRETMVRVAGKQAQPA